MLLDLARSIVLSAPREPTLDQVLIGRQNASPEPTSENALRQPHLTIQDDVVAATMRGHRVPELPEGRRFKQVLESSRK